MLQSLTRTALLRLQQSPLSSTLAALCLGALLPLSMAPLNLWGLSLLSPVLLALLTWRRSWRQAALTYLAFGTGFYGVGISWIYVSIHDFGNASMLLAGSLTALFVVFMGFVFTLTQGLSNHRWFARDSQSLPLHYLRFSAFWIAGEWFRTWFLTGFPWLLLGYSQVDTPLAGWAPVFGVMGISLLVLASGGAALCTLSGPIKRRLLAAAFIALLWMGGAGLKTIEWTQALEGSAVRVALIQPNIPQDQKWSPTFLQETLNRLQRLTEHTQSANWVIWPEAAIPLMYHQAQPFLEDISERALSRQQALISGILFDNRDNGKYYNSAVGLGQASGMYHKTHLVPFGEYVPLEDWLRGIIDFFNLPTSIITAGPEDQPGLSIGNHRPATAICYEVVYAELVAKQSRDRQILLTISNDAWFGHSWGPLQHLQMVQMRAIETGRYVIRGTNNGVSAIIDPTGKIQVRSEQFVTTLIDGVVEMRTGDTPFMRWRHAPVLLLSLLLLAYTRTGKGRLKPN